MAKKGKAAVRSGGQERSGTEGARLRAHSNRNQVYAQGRVVGRVRGGVFHKTVRGSVHMLRHPPAWAISIEALLQAEELGAKSVRVCDTESGHTYTASVDLVRRKGFTFDRGHGRQVGLPLEYWAVSHAGEPDMVQACLPGMGAGETGRDQPRTHQGWTRQVSTN